MKEENVKLKNEIMNLLRELRKKGVLSEKYS